MPRTLRASSTTTGSMSAPGKRWMRHIASYAVPAEQWHLKKISKPHLQHDTYSFFFWMATTTVRRS
jgi:hypothetical protein